jgi:phosphatidyl-myo-inositol dimannoside synthase
MRVIHALQEIGEQLDFALEIISLRDVAPAAVLPGSLSIQSARGSYFKFGLLLAKIHLRDRVTQVFVGHAKLVRCCLPTKLLFRRTRYRLFVHGVDVWSLDPARRPRWLSRTLLNYLIDEVIAVSRFTLHRMAASFRIKRSSVLPNAIDFQDSEVPGVPGEEVPHKGAPRLLSVSRLDSHDGPKGIDFALRAVAILRQQHPLIRYQIIGDGVLRGGLEELTGKLGLDECVEFSGRVSDAEVEQAFRSADIFLLPSRKEGFGIVFLEAWKFGLPVVCGNVDASSEVVEDGLDGFTVDPCSPQEIAAAVRKLLQDPGLRDRFVAHGRGKLLTCFSGTAFLQNLRQLVESGS